MSGERHGEPTGSDGKDDVQKSVERMRCVALRSGLAKCSRSSWRRLFPLRRNAWRSDTPAKRGRARPCSASGLRFNDHRLLHAARVGGDFDEPCGVIRRKRSDLCGAGDLCLNDANCNRKRVGKRLRAQRCGALARACGHDGHKLAHPIKNDNRNPMRSAEAHSLDRDEAAPSGHNDRGRHARAGIVSKSPSAIADKERTSPNRKVRVVGFRRYDARLDREPRLPKGVAFRVGGRVGYKLADGRSCPVAAFRWFSERCLPQAQQSLPRRSGIRPRSYFGIGAIDSRAGRARIKPRQRRRNIDRIAMSPPHTAKLSRAARRVIPLTPAAIAIANALCRCIYATVN